MNFKKATLHDANIIAKIRKDAYNNESETFPHQSKKYNLNPVCDDLNEIIDIINSFDYFLIIHRDVVIGSFWVHKSSATSVELEDFCILPSYQNQGFGYNALMLMEDLYPSMEKWVLSTFSYNTKNQHLYKKAGFRRIGNNDDSLIYLYEKCICKESSLYSQKIPSKITMQDFKKVDLRVCQVINCMPVKRSKNLLRFDLDDGINGRIVVSNINPIFNPKDLIGKKIIIVSNIIPSKSCNIQSEGLLLSGDTPQGSPGVVFVDDTIPVGFKIH